VSWVAPNPALLAPGAGGPAQSPMAPAKRAAAPPSTGPSFSDLLAQRTAAGATLRFSRHAVDRLQRRGIELSGSALARLTGGVAKAAAKGSRDSVVFVDGTAFVVSVASNTVITAVGSEHMREQVFTNIDSAVIA